MTVSLSAPRALPCLLVMLAFLARVPLLRASSASAASPLACNSYRSQTCPRSATNKASARMAPSVPDADHALNVLGGPLELCCNSPRTGFYRDGFCNTGAHDAGVHTVCARVTQPFLDFSRRRGNDLISPAPQYGFPGLKEGDGWCLCAARWLEAAQAGFPCPVVLAATHQKALTVVPLEMLREHAIDRDSVAA